MDDSGHSMKLARFNDDRLGIMNADDGSIVDVTDRLDLHSRDPLIEYLRRDLDASRYADETPDYDSKEVRLEAPVRRPGKVIAAPGNYVEHLGEVDDQYVDPVQRSTEEDVSYFLKAPSSVIGPEEKIELPFRDRRFDHEIELGFIMKQDVKNATLDEAWENIFGYTISLDITMRGQEDRSNRKSFDTFTPIGPVVVTADELENPHDLDISLAVNGEVRQSSNTEKMIMNCADIVEYASEGATVEAGDLLITGTCSGIGPITPGDTISAEIESIGSMELTVESNYREE